jgi:outer membrane lipoprotein-sorting protein
MRWTTLAALLLLAAPAYGQENDAEKLYRAMEKKIETAKSVHLVFETQLAGEAGKGEFKGNLHVAEGFKVRFEIDGKIVGNALKLLIISDGKLTYSKMNDKAETNDNSTNKEESEKWEKGLGLTARVGLVSSLFQVGTFQKKGDPKRDPHIDKLLPVNDFKLGAKEKIGAQETQVVHYTVKLGDGPLAKATVWIDTKTQLPIKRELIEQLDGKEGPRTTETYSTFTVNAKADPKLFELPK